MKVLFVAKAGDRDIFKAVVQNQFNSLLNSSITLKAFPIRGSGIMSYINAFLPLVRLICSFKPDIIHAHYSFSGIFMTLPSYKIPLVVSLMGSDIEARNIMLKIIRIFSNYFWAATVVKTEKMQNKLKIKKCLILPNGVDIDLFKPMDKKDAMQNIPWTDQKKNILFLADSKRREKNVDLAIQAVKLLKDTSCKIQIISNVPSTEVPFYLNAADVIILSSIWEGSPNIIKEAMACNRPIVSTPAGDVEEIINGVSGCYISSYEPKDFAKKISEALSFSETIGRNRIIELHLDSKSVSKRLIKIYKACVS